MAHNISLLKAKLTTEAQSAADGIGWGAVEAAVELLLTSLSGLTLGASDAANDPGSDASKALSVQAVTNGKPFPTKVIQYAGVPSDTTIRTADTDVFTLAAGEIGYIQNLASGAGLMVRLGTGATSTTGNFILPKCTADDDGTSPPFKIDFWVGIVSVAKMSGTGRHLAWKIAAT
jgi:hypothetical protein